MLKLHRRFTIMKSSINLQEELAKCKTIEDLTGKNGLLKRLLKEATEQMLEAEMTEHLGYEKHAAKGRNSGNSRNGHTGKTVHTDFGEVPLETPRDRQGTFEPQLVKKGQTDITDFDEKVISMYAKGMTVRDIQEHVKDFYGVDISPTFISHVTDKVMALVAQWQARHLDRRERRRALLAWRTERAEEPRRRRHPYRLRRRAEGFSGGDSAGVPKRGDAAVCRAPDPQFPQIRREQVPEGIRA